MFLTFLRPAVFSSALVSPDLERGKTCEFVYVEVVNLRRRVQLLPRPPAVVSGAHQQVSVEPTPRHD